jgi:hypothetical protein
MQYFREGSFQPTLCQKLYQTHGGKVGIMVINSQKGRTSSLAPKVSEAMDNQLPHEISGRHAELGLCSGEMMKCKYKGNRQQHL